MYVMFIHLMQLTEPLKYYNLQFWFVIIEMIYVSKKYITIYNPKACYLKVFYNQNNNRHLKMGSYTELM